MTGSTSLQDAILLMEQALALLDDAQQTLAAVHLKRALDIAKGIRPGGDGGPNTQRQTGRPRR